MSFKGFKFFISDYFTFSRKERISIIVLASLLILVISAIYFIRFNYNEASIDFSSFEKEVSAFEQQFQKENKPGVIASAGYKPKSEPSTKTHENFVFNPNHLPDSLWVRLGIAERTISVIRNYESKGGKFYKKEDLKKIYSFPAEDYSRLESYILIPPEEKKIVTNDSVNGIHNKFSKPFINKVILDLNTATEEDFKTLHGVGDYKAGSIVKYRTFLGGYVFKEQLLEAYGIDSALFDSIKNRVEIKTQMRIFININSNAEADLKHPYISKQLARLILNYRNVHGDFQSIEEIRKIKAISEELFLKLKPYLKAN